MSTKTRVESTAFSERGVEYMVLCIASFDLQLDAWRLTKIHVTGFADPPFTTYIEGDGQPFNALFESASSALRAGFERAIHDVRAGILSTAKPME